MLQSNTHFQMFLFNNTVFCIQSIGKGQPWLMQPVREGAVGSQYVLAAQFPSQQACAAGSSGPHSLIVSISASFSAGFRLNASSWPMFLLKTLNGAEMAPVRIFHKVFHCPVCEDILLVWPLCCRAPESLLASVRSADPGGDGHCPALLWDRPTPSAAVPELCQDTDRGLLRKPSTLGLERCAWFSLGLQVLLKIRDGVGANKHQSETSVCQE